jgi:hypothetical protein
MYSHFAETSPKTVAHLQSFLLSVQRFTSLRKNWPTLALTILARLFRARSMPTSRLKTFLSHVVLPALQSLNETLANGRKRPAKTMVSLVPLTPSLKMGLNINNTWPAVTGKRRVAMIRGTFSKKIGLCSRVETQVSFKSFNDFMDFLNKHDLVRPIRREGYVEFKTPLYSDKPAQSLKDVGGLTFSQLNTTFEMVSVR